MTTPLAHEPMPGDGLVPHMRVLADRLYQRLPEIYRTMDAANSEWVLKRLIGAYTDTAGLVDDTIDAIRGERPVGPATPEPWALRPDEIVTWRENRLSRASALGDPMQAEPDWLPWMAQLVGARLDPAASVEEQRDTIRYATSGWRGGTRQAIADAARTALTGSRYARVEPHSKAPSGSLEAGSVWDITIVTRASETPDPGAVLDAVLRKGVKPAGAVLWHAMYEATWAQIEAAFPLWEMWDAATWDQLAAVGSTYIPTPGNLITTNPSFEDGVTGWTALANSTHGAITGGVHGTGALRVTAVGAGSAGVSADVLTATPGVYHVSLSLRPDQSRSGKISVAFTDGGSPLTTQDLPFGPLTADEWTRVGGSVTAPADTDALTISVQLDGLAAAELFDLDAAYAKGL